MKLKVIDADQGLQKVYKFIKPKKVVRPFLPSGLTLKHKGL